MLASGSRKGHRGEEGEAAVERKAVLGGRGALACGRGRGRGARFTGSLDLQKARGLENGQLPKRIPPFDDFLMSCDRVTTQRTQRNAIIVTRCPQTALRLRALKLLLRRDVAFLLDGAWRSWRTRAPRR